MIQIKYSVLKTFAVIRTASSVSRQAIAKSMRPLRCNIQVESRPAASIMFITRVTLADKGLRTLDDPNEMAYVSGVFQSKLAIQKIEVGSDSTSAGRLMKYHSGANVPATLKRSETPISSRQIPTTTPS